MTDTNQQPGQQARNEAEAVRRLVTEGVCDVQAALEHVQNEQRGRDLARRANERQGYQKEPKQ